MTPGVLLRPCLDLGLDVEIGLPVPGPGPPAPEVVAEVAPAESDRSLLGELAHVHELVGDQRPVAGGVPVVAEEDEPADRHAVRTIGEERHLHHPNALRERSGQDVIGDEFGTFEPTHETSVGGGHPAIRSMRPVSSDRLATMHDEHYGRVDALADVILEGLGDPDSLTIDDLAPADEFHLGGAAATAAIIDALGVGAGDRVLDIGSGVGGPARRIAASTGAHVTGVDLTASFVAAANALSARVALGEQTTFVVGDATQLDLDGPFDGATLIHVGMNIPDKAAFFAGVHGLLAPGARLVVYDIMAIGDVADVGYPMPFAAGLEGAFLASPAAYREALLGAGFAVDEPVDRTTLALEAAAAARADGPPPVSLATIMGPDFATMFSNLAAALQGGLLAPVQIVATRSTEP